MAKMNLVSMSIDELLKLRDDVANILSQKAEQLRTQLSQVGGGYGRGRSPMKGRKVPVKYRDNDGNTWAGRGAQPRWLREKLKTGSKLEDFTVRKSATARNTSTGKTRKTKKRRKAKR